MRLTAAGPLRPAGGGEGGHPERFPLRPADLWRYRELLPVEDPRHVTTLGEGWTPLLRAPAYGSEIGITDLMVKDEG
ncbi:hypothetical protein NKG94_27850 [Micromonospora sp. M12]